ncbi:lantibiotic dehydratase [Streptomyces sp. LHD-70]|uniref:lantibiotic dehydratase n=1 Tax=Streptomyces sp. LHD-70 TaxID=3072140 RepID=UPI00280DF143|nr:lantibiotic dehydratase [Streptomyces sp. LHD-70]MDQ8708230.1 lantibiotic dehydratase [Streptomyces sp. LHD-70]
MRINPTFQRHGNTLLLRAAAMPVSARPERWPAVDDPDSCRDWLQDVWRDDTFVQALRVASPGLADSVEQILVGNGAPAKRVRKATCSVAHYLLRATGRATPFGLFAGVAMAELGPAHAEFATHHHRAVARIDTLWLDQVRQDLLRRPDVLPLLNLRIHDFAVQRGGTVETSVPDGRLGTARVTAPLAVLLDAATGVSGQVLIERLVDAGGTREQAPSLIGSALDQGLLTSDLSSPMTTTDPTGHILRALRPHTEALDETTLDLLAALADVQQLIEAHNGATAPASARELRASAEQRMRSIADAGRSRVSLDLRLDATVRVPEQVLEEARYAAHALLRLTRTQGEKPAWAAYHSVFWERYGSGCLVPVRDAADLASGVGLPSDYPQSLWTEAPSTVLPRDEWLLALAWQAVAAGDREILLTDDLLDELGDTAEPDVPVAPHVELAVQVRADSQQAVDHGDFTLTVRPAWTVGNLTGRFASLLRDDGLSDLYSTLPTMVDGAVPAQLSFTPVHPHAENVARIPTLLPYVISVGEHRPPGAEQIGLDDLAVFSTGRRLHLVSLSRRRIVEPVVLHPLALEKQAPPLARFLAMLGRGFATHWTEFDWGPFASEAPYLPRVRYRRAILTPARWRLSAAELPSGAFDAAWQKALTEWAVRWKCPDVVELRDDDRTLRLDLSESLHARLLFRHLQHNEHATLTETATDNELAWIGHAHEVILPLVSTRKPSPHPDLAHAPIVTNRSLAHPGDDKQRWFQAKLFTHPAAMEDVLTRHLSSLMQELGDPAHWFVRYRSLHEEDHLRLRIAASGPEGHATITRALAAWATRLTETHLASRLVFDAYRPEWGRYGTGAAMDAAEDVFVADSLAVRVALTGLPALDRRVLCALGVIDIAQGLLGLREGLEWLASAPTAGGGQLDVTRHALQYAVSEPLIRTSPRLAAAQAERRAALCSYRGLLNEPQLEAVLDSLLHMHHNRILGPDRDSEAISRHAARQASRSLLKREAGQ